MRRFAPFGLLLLGAGLLGAQQQPLRPVAENARSAVSRGQLQGLFGRPRVQLRLPGVEPSAPVSPAQAEAALREAFQGSETAEVRLQGFRQTGPDQGYVELRREYRTPGSRAPRTHQILLGYRLINGQWALVDLRVN